MQNNRPFATPRYITPPDVLVPFNEDDFEYIMSKGELGALQNTLSSEILYATTILEFRDKKTVRNDSKTASVTLRPSCNLFRICASHKYCDECDASHASLFRDTSRDNLEDSLNSRVKSFVPENPILVGLHTDLKVEVVQGRPYISYNCPMLGYRELCFPIYCDDNVIATLFVGQIKLDGYNEYIKHQKEEFFEKNLNIFDEYIDGTLDKYNLFTGKQLTRNEYRRCIQQTIIENDSKNMFPNQYPYYFPVPDGMFNTGLPDFVKSKAYDDLLDAICVQIANIEKAISSKLRDKRIGYIRKSVDRMITKFYDNLGTFGNAIAYEDIDHHDAKTFQNMAKESIDTFWDNVQQRMVELVIELDFQSIIIFGPGSGSLSEEGILNPKVHASSLTRANPFLGNEDKLCFYMQRLPIGCFNHPISSNQKPELFEGLSTFEKERKPRDKKTLLLFPVKYKIGASTALLIRFKEDTRNVIDTIEADLSQTMLWLISNIFSALSSLIESIALLSAEIEKKISMDTLSIFRHEIYPQVLSLRDIFDRYLGKPKYLMGLSQDKVDDIIMDADGFLRLLNIITQNIGIFTNSRPHIQKSEFSIYNLIMRWKHIRREEMSKKSIWLYHPESRTKNAIDRFLYTDKVLLEQIFYNILSNAIKYSFWGTQICIDFHSEQYKYYLQITDYGCGITNDNTPYQLYYRDPSYVYGIKGNGIGLYVAQVAANYLGGIVTHRCEKLSVYNIPLIEAYLVKPFRNREKDQELMLRLSECLHVCKDTGLYFDIIPKEITDNYDRYIAKLTEQQIAEEIKWPIYKVEFTVEMNL